MDPSRRPIAARNTRLADKAAAWLVESQVTPNQISQASIAFGALAGLAFWGAGEADGVLRVLCLLIAALACQGRLLCNLFDGMVALEGGKAGKDGPFWNEAPDRISDIAIFVGLGLGAGAPALGWSVATLAVLVAYLRELGVNAGLDADFSGPMAKPHRMALTTAAALLAILVPSMLGMGTLQIALWILAFGTAFTAWRRSMRIVRRLKRS